MLFAMLPMTVVRRKIKSVMDKTIKTDAALLTAYNETYNGNKTIISYNLHDKQRCRFEEVLGGVFSLRMKMLKRTRWLPQLCTLFYLLVLVWLFGSVHI